MLARGEALSRPNHGKNCPPSQIPKLPVISPSLCHISQTLLLAHRYGFISLIRSECCADALGQGGVNQEERVKAGGKKGFSKREKLEDTYRHFLELSL